MKLYAPSTIKELKTKYDFHLSKSLGQNFIADGHIIDKIIESSHIGEEDLVIEIGPGMGVLTAAAAQKAEKVIAIEIDKALMPILEETLAEYDNVEIINQDILEADLCQIIKEQNHRGGVKILGNLPYYITTPIIMKVLEDRVPADSITIMMQKEVADRLKAMPGSKTYGAISAAVQYYCQVNLVASVPKEVFVPRPKVDSAVLRLDIRRESPVALISEQVFFSCIKAGFGQRRKTLLNALTGMGGLSKQEVRTVLELAEIDGIRRAETLTLEEFARIANQIAGD